MKRSRGLYSAREAAAEVVARVLEDGAWVSIALDAVLKREAMALSSTDRAFATELSYGTLRWSTSLEQSLLRGAEKPGRGFDKKIRPHLLVAAYQMHHLADRIPAHAAVNEAVRAIRQVRPGLAGFANAILRRLGSPAHLQLPASASSEEWATALGIPSPLWESLVEGLPVHEHAEALLACQERPPLGVRWLGPPEAEAGFAEALSAREARVRPHPFVPHAWLLDGAGSAAQLPGFSAGHVIVQDPGSQIVALLADAQPGMCALDLAAAPGGKSMVLARAVGAEGRVIAVELDDKRARRIEENAARLRTPQVTVRVGDARQVIAAQPMPEGADIVLLDAPCTGLGTVRRRPEIKLKRGSDDVRARASLQRELLDVAASQVKPAGTLVYAVCSPIREEGRDVVESFLAAHPEFRLCHAQEVLPWLPANAVDDRGQVQLSIHRHQADAFFAARLQKNP